MNTWKVILATLVIFITGLFTGSALLRKFGPGPFPPRWERPGERPSPPWEPREEYVQRLTRELALTPSQTETISTILTKSQQRIEAIYKERITPEMQQVQEDIRAVLTPDQQSKFEEMRKQHRRFRPGGGAPERGRWRNRGPAGAPQSNQSFVFPPPPDERGPLPPPGP